MINYESLQPGGIPRRRIANDHELAILRESLTHPDSPFSVSSINRTKRTSFDARAVTLNTDIADSIKQLCHHGDGFSTVVYPFGGPDIISVLDLVADGGRIISIGKDVVTDFPHALRPTRRRNDWETYVAADTRALEEGIFAYPTKNTTRFSHWPTMVFETHLAAAGLSAEDITVNSQEIISKGFGKSPIVLTSMSISYHNKLIELQLVNGFRFPKHSNLREASVEFRLLKAILGDLNPNDTLAVSKAAHGIGLASIAPFLPDNTTFVTDNIALETAGRYSLEDQQRITVTMPSDMMWGYAESTQNIRVGKIHPSKTERRAVLGFQ